jgi:hypothetical protein
MKEFVLGFDARKMEFSENIWSPERRKTFLVKSDVETPLSVDTSVWNSVFGINKSIQQSDRKGWRQNTWASLLELQKSLQSQSKTKLGDYWNIAITQFADDKTIAEIGIDVLPVIPNTINAAWQFLGYDVAELTLLSSLMNMGYREEEKNFAEKKFGDYLNLYHLFTQVEIAEEFSSWSDARDRGHGPFYVYGLYRINET